MAIELNSWVREGSRTDLGSDTVPPNFLLGSSPTAGGTGWRMGTEGLTHSAAASPSYQLRAINHKDAGWAGDLGQCGWVWRLEVYHS